MKAWYQKHNHILYYNFQYGPESDGFIMDIDQLIYKRPIIKNPEKYNIYEIETEDDFPVEIIDPDIRIIKFNYAFNQNIPKLPSNIEELYFDGGDSELCQVSLFNKSLSNLSYGIKRLYLNYSFNQELLNLPESLEYLELTGAFDQLLDFLPNSVKEIHIVHKPGPDGEPLLSCFNQPLNNLPENLEVLELDCMDFNHPLDNLPEKLKCLKLNLYAFKYNIPERLKNIILEK